MLKNTMSDQYYTPPSSSIWKGRISPQGNTAQYWHEIIQIHDLHNLNKNGNTPQIGIMSYACDEGVKRNKGRIGAANGPEKILKQLAKLPVHFKHRAIADFGTLHCPLGDLASAQNQLADATAKRIKTGVFPINIGGGHDIAFATYCGVRDAIEPKENISLGIINFDAHFDLRPTLNVGNSGTPFYQMLQDQSTALLKEYAVIGVQRQSNIPALFTTAQNHGVAYINSEDCTADSQHLNAVHSILDRLIKRNDHIYLSIDMDAFSSAYAPGVSAPSALGFGPVFFFNVLDFLLDSPKIIAIDIAETNPHFDRDDATSRLAARIIDRIATKLNSKNLRQ